MFIDWRIIFSRVFFSVALVPDLFISFSDGTSLLVDNAAALSEEERKDFLPRDGCICAEPSSRVAHVKSFT